MNNRILPKQFGRALIQPATLDKENRTVDVVFATETPVFRAGWEEDYDEILSCEAAAVRMERINKGLPVVDSHSTYSVFKQLGRTEKVWFDEKKREIWARIKFSQRAEVVDLFKDIEDGIVGDISVGYRVYKFEREPQAVGKNPIYRAVDWIPTEISFCSVPADVNSGTRSATTEENEVIIIDKQRTMNTNTDTTPATVPTPAPATTPPAQRAEPTPVPAPDLDKIRKDATDNERTRLNTILTSVRAAGLPDSFAIELYTSENSVEHCRHEIILKAVGKQTPAPNGSHTSSVGEEAIDKKRTAIEGVVLNRVAPGTFKLAEDAREFRGMSMIEIARELLAERGINTRGEDKNGIAKIVFGSRMHSTSDFPLLFENVIDKMLRADYNFAPEFWHLIARQTSVNDFREKGLYQVESINGMKEISEGGDIQYTTLAESKQTIRVKSYAEGIKFTRQAFINDDLGALSIIPQRFVKDWDEKRGDLVWSLIMDNVKMHDGKTLYSTDHNNLITGATSALSEAGLTAALVKAKTQTGLGNRRIRVTPKFLIVPPELEVTALKLITAITASTTKDVNVFTNKFDVIVEPRLTNANEWYLMSDPAAVEGLLYAYLDGNEALRTSTEENFDSDSMKFAVRGEFGAAAIDHRGTIKSAGK